MKYCRIWVGNTFYKKYYTLVHQWQFSCMKNQIAQQGWIHLNTILKNISPCSYITWDVNILAKEHQLSQLHTTIKERKHSFVKSISNSLGIVSFLFIMLSISLSSNSFRYKENDKLRLWSTQMIFFLAFVQKIFGHLKKKTLFAGLQLFPQRNPLL